MYNELTDVRSDLRDSVGLEVFHPTAAYSTKFDYAFTAGTAYLFENNGAIRCTLSTNNGTSKVEDIGTIQPGETLSFVATTNAPKLNCYLASADSTGSISVYSGQIAKSEIRTEERFDKFNDLSTPISVDEDNTVTTRFSQGTHQDPTLANRVMSDYIALNPGDKITVSELSGYQHKIFVFPNSSTIYPSAQTDFDVAATYTNILPATRYVRIDTKKTDDSVLTPKDIVGIKISITHPTSLSEIVNLAELNSESLIKGAGISNSEFSLVQKGIDVFAFTFVSGKHYIITNKLNTSVTVSTRLTVSSTDRLEAIATIEAGETYVFVPQHDAGAIVLYASGTNALISVVYGDGVEVLYDIGTIKNDIGDIADSVDALSDSMDDIDGALNALDMPVYVDDDCTVMTRFSQGTHQNPTATNRIMSTHILLNPGDTIAVGEIAGYQHKIFIFASKTETGAATETTFGTTTSYTNVKNVVRYARIDTKRTDDADLIPRDIIGLKMTISTANDLTETKELVQENHEAIEKALGILCAKFNASTTATMYPFAFSFVAGKHYIITNGSADSATLTTRLTTDAESRIDLIGTLSGNSSIVFVPQTDAGALFVYSSTKDACVSILYGDGLEQFYGTKTLIGSKQAKVTEYDLAFEHKEYNSGVVDSTTKLLSRCIFVNGSDEIKAVCGSDIQTRIIRFALDNSVGSTTQYGTTVTMTISVPCYVRIEVKRTDGADIDISDTVGLSVYKGGYAVETGADDFIKAKSKHNLFNPRLEMLNNKTFDSSGAFVTNTYWAVAPLIDVMEYRGHTISCNKWFTLNSRYAVFYADDGTTATALIDGNPISIPNNASYAAIPLNKKDENIKTLEDTVIWIDDLYDPVAEYNPLSASMPLRTFYTVPDHVKGCLEDGSPFRLDSTTKLQDVYDFYDRLRITFNTVMTREQIATSSTPTGTYAEEDPNTYPLYAYHIYPSVAPRTTDNVIVVCSCIHGDSYPNGATVPCDVFEHVAALAYVVEDLLFNPENNDITKFIREQCHLVVIPVVNPWGCQNGHRWNGRGIDLNRQFPDGFVPNRVEYDCSSGSEALCENESKGIYDFLVALHAEHPIKYFIDFQSRGGAYGIGANDNRYLPIFKTGSYAQQRIMQRVGDTLVRRFGGVYDPQGWDAMGQLSVWVYDTMNIMSFTCETFGAPKDDVYHRGHSYHLKNSVAFYGETLDVFTRHCVMGWNTYR